MPDEPYKPRIFISYAHADEPEKPVEGEAKWLSFVTGYLKPAVKHGAVELWVDRVMPGGADWSPEIERNIRACDIFILLVSPASLSSDYVVDKEIPIIRERQAKGEGVHFYPVLLKPTPDIALGVLRDKNLRPRDAKAFSGYAINDRFGPMNEIANEIVAIAAEIAKKKTGPIASARSDAFKSLDLRFPLSNIPVNVPLHFLGRDNELAKIDAALKGEKGRVAALHGLLGVGKSTLAAAYAERDRNDYRATWWIRAQTESTMRADLVSLGVRLGWVAADEKEEPALAAVRERLRHEGEGLLLIYDNAIDAASLRPYLPAGGAAHALVTSNSPAWRGVATLVEIPLWPKEVGADFFIARTGRDKERADAEALSEALGRLTLAHEQAAAYCERIGISLAEYRKRFEAAPARLLDADKDASAEYHGGLTVAKTFALAIDEAAKMHPAAELLIAYAALLAPEPIPLFLFSEGREKFGEPLASQLVDDGLEEAVGALRVFALVDRETIPDERDPGIATEAIRLHRLVRAVAAGRLKADATESTRRALIEAMAAVYPSNVYDDPSAWPRARRLDALALDLVGGSTAPPKGAETSASFLLDRLGSYRQAVLAAYSEARPLFERALVIDERALGPEHPETATRLNNLALVLQYQGDLESARRLYERALAIREKELGSEHPDSLASLNNLAALLRSRGDLAGARPVHERALAIREKSLGPEHSDTARSLNNLASVLLAQRDLAGARPLLERALAIFEKALGPEHPDTATSLDNLAGLLQVQGDLASARPLYERALAIRQKALGPEHPHTATSLNNLSYLLQAQGDLAGARPLYERALAIYEKALGSEHPDTATSLNNLASLLKDQGDFSGARPLFERALAIAEKALDPEHPKTATSLNNLAFLLQAQGDLAGARPLHERALAISEKALGPEHPNTATSLNNLARLLQAQGDLAGARLHYERALAINEKALGPEHPGTNLTRANLASLRLAEGAPLEALEMSEPALARLENTLGANHTWTKATARVTAGSLDALGRAEEAAALRARYGLGAGSAS